MSLALSACLPLVLPDTVPFLDGNGATVDVAIPGTTRSAPASALSVATGSTDTAIANLTLDLSDSPYTRGVAIISASQVTISGVTMTGSTFRAIEVAATTGPVTDVLITGNTASSPAGTAETKGEVVSVMLATVFEHPDDQFSSSTRPTWDRYTTDGTLSPTTYEHRNISVVGNTITGGYYGVSLSGVTDVTLRGNTILGQEYSEGLRTHEGTLPSVGSATITFADDSIGTYTSTGS
ncbi:MAG: hypothetical protein Q4C85_05495 [Actinomyces sp.]|uniref:hypothetical protein n=1 Tax=Actinomyces sp. TaxID=29317 RepID=UPI0026DB9BD6|nr:hypothetical protein [Actinomyces sp.]MDO4243204.1 hypothetical protein [Actinomyces sp.]